MKSGSAQSGKKFWVKAKQIMAATGWSKDEMRQARTLGWITWEHTEEKGFMYDLNSVHPLLIKKGQQVTA